METSRRSPSDSAAFQAIYDRHFDFVWRTLRHLGVRTADLSDACQEVFIVVHRRLPSFEERAKVTTWLFRICANLARDRRRLAHVRTEVLGDAALEDATRRSDPSAELERQDKLATFEAALQSMSFDQRAAFILFEIEGLSGPEAAAALEIPLPTAYSRLRLARQTFLAAVERESDRGLRAGARRGGTA